MNISQRKTLHKFTARKEPAANVGDWLVMAIAAVILILLGVIR